MRRHITFLFILLFVFCGTFISAGNNYVIVIDPGHGGKDSGAIRSGYKEKDINLGVALVLGELIEKNMPDVKVVYTRKEDAFVALDKRADIANKAKANLFISIHTNSTAAKKTTASGADTYILGLSRSEENLEVAKRENSVILLEDDYTTKYEGFDPNSPESYIIFEFMTNKYRDQSLDFAGYVQRDFKKVAKRQDRGVREAGFLVLRKTSMPSVLIELGFINNDNEAKFLSSKSGQRIMATSIFSGFKDYKKNLDKIQGNDNKTVERKTISSKEPDKSNLAQVNQQATTIKEVAPTFKEAKSKPKEQVKEEVSKLDINTLKEETKVVENPNKQQQLSTVKEEKSVKKTEIIPVVKRETKKENNQGPTYRIQFLYSPQRYKAGASEFKGLNPVEYFFESGYKYTYGETTNLSEIEKALLEVRTKFKDAFVIIDDSKKQRKYLSLSNMDNDKPENIEEKKKPVVKINAVSAVIKPDQIEYRVQFLYSPNILRDNSPQFKGLSPVDVYEDNGGYKYTYGSTTSQDDIRKVQREVNKLFKDAFIVQFKNGVRIK